METSGWYHVTTVIRKVCGLKGSSTLDVTVKAENSLQGYIDSG